MASGLVEAHTGNGGTCSCCPGPGAARQTAGLCRRTDRSGISRRRGIARARQASDRTGRKLAARRMRRWCGTTERRSNGVARVPPASPRPSGRHRTLASVRAICIGIVNGLLTLGRNLPRYRAASPTASMRAQPAGAPPHHLGREVARLAGEIDELPLADLDRANRDVALRRRVEVDRPFRHVAQPLKRFARPGKEVHASERDSMDSLRPSRLPVSLP